MSAAGGSLFFLFVVIIALLSVRVVDALHVASPSNFHSLRGTTVLSSRPKRQRQKDSDENLDDTLEATAIPANLRRKVQAKRPLLGHIVPASVRLRNKRKKSGGTSAPTLRPQGQSGMYMNNKNNPSNLKIAGGMARGRRLLSPGDSVYLRPMMGKVKEAVYSTLTAFGLYETKSTRHLDIFAGSGSVGLESLSRGAAHCTFVDLAPDCCACIESNLEMLSQLDADSKVVCAEAMKALQEPDSVGIEMDKPFQIVTLCPPYEEVVYGDLVEAAVGSPCVGDDTVLIVEYPVELGCLPHVVIHNNNTAVGVRNRRYGRTVIAMYVINPTGQLDESASSRPEEFVAVG
jgi:16S rRNA (guanine(966)-N(2))-methyltransferase RsmD